MTTTTMMDKLFPAIIGQEAAKRKLKFYIEGFEATSICPHLLFVAPKGAGKTTLAKAFARNLKDRHEDKPKRFLEINCATIKNLKQFMNEIVVTHMIDRDATILFDEASELPKSVTMALLTILNPNKDNMTTFSYEDYTFDCDFRRLSFLFATTESHQIFHALLDRMDRVDLEEYSHDDLSKIMEISIEKIKFKSDVLAHIAPTLRGNARAAQKLSQKIDIYCGRKGSSEFDNDDWMKLKRTLDILPLGLTRIELSLLRYLSHGPRRLTNLSAKMGMTKAALQRDMEMYLQKMELIEILPAGRALTGIGQEYLQDFKKWFK